MTNEPSFLNLSARNLQLSAASPCIDAGSTNWVRGGDFNDMPRPLDGNNDGVSAWAEVHTHGTNPLDPDTDGDSLSDGGEVLAGTGPNDVRDNLAVFGWDSGQSQMLLRWWGVKNRSYTLWQSPAILSDESDWTRTPDIPMLHGSNVILECAPTPDSETRYYRIQAGWNRH